MLQTANSVLILFLTLGLLNTSNKNNIENDIEKVASIKFASEIIDYGTIAQYADGTKVFYFTNEGEAPLVITDIKTSCGCTVPTYSKEPILPGNTGQLQIKYDTKRLGAFTKTITVISNSENGNSVLKIKGTVVAAE